MKVFITGSRCGIGNACFKLFQEKGYEVLGVAKNASPTSLPLDITKQNDRDDFFKEHHSFFTECDIFINNAGLALGMDSIEDLSAIDREIMIQTNISAFTHLTAKIIPFMRKRASGDLIMMGSIAAFDSYPGGAIYGGSKAYVHQFSNNLRHDLAGTGIRVAVVAPARVETQFSVNRFAGDNERANKVYQGYTPLSASDIAETIYWIVSRPRHINISNITLWPTEQVSALTIKPFHNIKV